jgi:hypothetical protein
MRHLVFVSYAREDEATLQPFFKALGGRTFDVFLDTGVPPATEWDPKIKAALEEATVILMFVSPDWERKPYCIWEKERALARQAGPPEDRWPRILPVHLRPVHVDPQGIFRFTSPWPTKNALVETLTTAPAWERAAAELVATLLKLTAAPPAPPPPPPDTKLPPPRPAVHHAAHGRRLDLYATRAGTQVAWRATDVDGPREVGAWEGDLPAWLTEERWPDEVKAGRRSPVEVGEALGLTLLQHAPADWCRDDLQGLGAALRVRLITEDPTLAALPWRWLRTRAWWIAERRWTWEIALRPPHGSATLQRSASSLLLLPEARIGPSGPHAAAITGLLDEAWNHRAAVTTTQGDLPSAKAPPHIIYALARPPAHPRTGACAVDRMLGEADLPLAAWTTLVAAGPADLLIWLGIGGRLPLPAALRAAPKALITCALPLTPAEAQELGEALLTAVLHQRLDPARAVEHAYAQLPTLAASAAIAHTAVEEYRVDRPPREGPDPSTAILLIDRDRQRMAAAERARVLSAGNSNVRITLILGLSPPDPRLKPEELQRTVLEQVDAAIDPLLYPSNLPWRLPPGASLDDHLNDQNTQLHTFTGGGHLGAPAGRDRNLLVWLNAGTVAHACDWPDADHRVELTDLVAWMQATQHALANHLPPRPAGDSAPLTVIVWLTVITTDSRTLEEACPLAVRRPPHGWSTHAVAEVLPVISHLDEDHIYRFLLEKTSGCPPEHADAISRLIFADHTPRGATHAVFADTVRDLERGMASGWAAWIERLTRPRS